MRVVHRSVAGGDLPLAVWTSGPIRSSVPVLLVHGMASDHTTWRSLASSLRHVGRSVISVDLRGHGRSGRSSYRLDDFADDLGFVLDQLDLDTVDVVGHSLGAHSALRMAVANPDRVRKLVLEEIPPMPRDQADLDEDIVISARLVEQVRGVWAAARNPLLLMRFDDTMSDIVAAQFRRAGPDWWSALPKVGAETLVISGGSRSFLPPQHLRALTEALPGARYTSIDVGHSVHRDARIRFDATVSDFLYRPN